MKLRKSVVLPCVLLAYLAVMTYIGYGGYRRGEYSPLYFFGVVGITLAIIISLFFFLRKREKLRAEREADIRLQEEKEKSSNHADE